MYVCIRFHSATLAIERAYELAQVHCLSSFLSFACLSVCLPSSASRTKRKRRNSCPRCLLGLYHHECPRLWRCRWRARISCGQSTDRMSFNGFRRLSLKPAELATKGSPQNRDLELLLRAVSDDLLARLPSTAKMRHNREEGRTLKRQENASESRFANALQSANRNRSAFRFGTAFQQSTSMSSSNVLLDGVHGVQG